VLVTANVLPLQFLSVTHPSLSKGVGFQKLRSRMLQVSGAALQMTHTGGPQWPRACSGLGEARRPAAIASDVRMRAGQFAAHCVAKSAHL
jgi:hypothetical protein